MYIVFFSTSDVFKTEEALLDASIECKVVPTPVQDKAYCGVCVETSNERALEYIDTREFEILE